VRITGGLYRGRILEAPKGRDIRPTSDKVRLAIFNMLNGRGLVRDAVVMDAFCGTGALGIEALSWGAKHCLFIDQARVSLDLCKKNCAALDVKYASFLLKDSSKLGERPSSIPAANLVFLDPPYRKGLVEESIRALTDGGWLAEECYLVIETEENFDEGLIDADILVSKTYGDTKVTLCAVRPSA
jgi:16S rRNA (guanine966-N2)-methyltransferase